MLPDPSKPDSLASVQRAADNLAGVGKIMLQDSDSNGNVCFGGCGTMRWWFRPEHGFGWGCEEAIIDDEEAAADLISIAAQRIGPIKICNCENIVQHPLLLRAVFDWGHAFIESVCLGQHYDPPPHVWQALQQLQRLSTVVFWPEYDSKRRVVERQIPVLVCDAAQHYVIPTQKNLRMEFCICDSDDDDDDDEHDDDDDDDDDVNDDEDEDEDGPQDGATDIYSSYHATIQGKLPAGSKLVSAELQPAGNSRDTYIYGGACNPKAFWVAIAGPS